MILKNKNGITLISLTITIIILLILAGISIFSIIGNNGLFDKALLAKNSFIESVINEEEKINSYFNYTDESIDDNFSSKYQEIEYIESTGTQYIELFKKLNSETIIKSKFLITQFSDASLFGVYTINHDKSYGLHCSNSSSYFRVGSNASAASKNLNTIYDWTFSKNGIIDNTTNKSLLTFKKQLTPFTGDNNTPIFARRATNGDIVLGFFKIYNFTIHFNFRRKRTYFYLFNHEFIIKIIIIFFIYYFFEQIPFWFR